MIFGCGSPSRLSFKAATVGMLLLLGGCGERDAERAVASTLAEPSSARFQSVEKRGDAVCGEVKASGEGGTAGYARFVYQEGAATIEPRTRYTPADLGGFDATCRMLGGQGNGLDRQVCTRAAGARQAVDKARAFEALWRRRCA